MAQTLTVDVLSETGLVQTLDRWEKTRLLKLHGIANTHWGPGLEAYALGVSAVPRMRDPHPVTSGLFVIEREAKAISLDAVQIRLKYASNKTPPGGNPDHPEDPVYSGSSSLSQTNTSVDRNGTPITVSWGGVTKRGKVPRRIVHRTLTVTRIESGIIPEDIADAYSGKVNSTTWLGKPRGSWLCTGIDDSTTDGGQTIKMVYKFARRDDFKLDATHNKSSPWNEVAIFLDDRGEQPSGLVYNTGYKEVDLVEFADFNLLGI